VFFHNVYSYTEDCWKRKDDAIHKKQVNGRNIPFTKILNKILYITTYIYLNGVMTSETFKCILFRLPFKCQLSNQKETRMFCGAVSVHDLPG
jgi:hypothetical protein